MTYKGYIRSDLCDTLRLRVRELVWHKRGAKSGGLQIKEVNWHGAYLHIYPKIGNRVLLKIKSKVKFLKFHLSRAARNFFEFFMCIKDIQKFKKIGFFYSKEKK